MWKFRSDERNGAGPELFDRIEKQQLREELELRRKRRVKDAAIQLYPVAVPLGLMAAVADAIWGDRLLAVFEIIFTLACAISYFGTRKSDKNLWGPAFFGLWSCSIAGIFRTGGINSPLFAHAINLLFLAGVITQSTFRIRYVALFLVLNFGIIAAFPGSISVPAQNLPYWLVLTKQLALILGMFACVRAFIISQERLTKEVLKQKRQLLDTRASLTHVARLAEMGNLVATTAHEIAQPVQVIATASSLISSLIEKGDRPDTVAQLGKRISESTQRISRLLAQLREFTRNDPLEFRQLDLCEAVRGVKLLADYDLRTRNVKLDFDLPLDPIWVRGDSLRIQQVLLNLINNARDAALTSPLPRVSIMAKIERGWARVSVLNSGPEIPLEIQQKLFTQSYFTTKSKGKGTGIGLKISSQLIEQHGGRIFFSSQENETLFIVDLPIHAPPRLTSKNVSSEDSGNKSGILAS